MICGNCNRTVAYKIRTVTFHLDGHCLDKNRLVDLAKQSWISRPNLRMISWETHDQIAFESGDLLLLIIPPQKDQLLQVIQIINNYYSRRKITCEVIE